MTFGIRIDQLAALRAPPSPSLESISSIGSMLSPAIDSDEKSLDINNLKLSFGDAVKILVAAVEAAKTVGPDQTFVTSETPVNNSPVPSPAGLPVDKDLLEGKMKHGRFYMDECFFTIVVSHFSLLPSTFSQ
jgi:hypothetical protein